MKIQPVNSIGDLETLREPMRADPGKPVFKSRLRRLFDRQFPSVLRNSSTDKLIAAENQHLPQWPAIKDETGGGELEPSSLCLAKMVQNFMEENYEKQITSAKCGRNRCNCFNGNINDSSDDELDVSFGFHDSNSSSSLADVGDFLKSLISCGSLAERNLLADTSRIVEKNKLIKRKEDLRAIVADGLSSAGYDASICKSRWDKSPAYPAGEYEYIDVLVDGERLIIDIDFRSEFEIARSTGSYKVILQVVPNIFVGKGDRLQQIVSMVCEAARQSLKKKGMHFPPWRKAEYMRSKWLAAYTRARQGPSEGVEMSECGQSSDVESEHGALELIFGEEEEAAVDSGEVEVMKPAWHPPPVKPKSCGKAVVTGLASLLRD
uniref:Uncharacterized protein n=1 Tax=Kalanchoe fedtschenkoi TaxID=63787 RepID=A0A7N0TSY1_KALFE